MDSSVSSDCSSEEAYATVSSAPPKRRAGRTKFRETRHPVYKGVRRRNADRWVCEVREPNKKSRIWLGTFPTAEMAARAHDVAALALRGRAACLNFADSPRVLQVPSSRSPREIQRAAAEAAEKFRPKGDQNGCFGSSSGTGEEAVGEEFDPFALEDGLDFGMQGYLDMAQGMLIDPPPPPSPLQSVNPEEEETGCGDMGLWNYTL
ncbi:dehydration-responsive element-binding protein 1G-like [Typha angustifolia]|uniref:dehydration-responsive element-binding protein 1G-like n=1 Tax=Typha angustifolia TaxID=59011 RepID=UPI003C2DEA14